MNGGADLGGMQGFGPVVDEPEREFWHADWEPRVLGMVVALGACGQWNIDQSRHARESLPPADYLRFPYYRIWMEGVEALMLKRGMVTQQELQTGQVSTPPINVRGRLEASNTWDVLHSLAGSAEREISKDPAFQVGDAIETINAHPKGHTRLPRYARSRRGTISKILGFHVFPDSAGNDKGDDPHWLYQVRFSARELWGNEKNPNDTVTLDLWEPHLVKN